MTTSSTLFDGLSAEVRQHIETVYSISLKRRSLITADHLIWAVLQSPAVSAELQTRAVRVEDARKQLEEWLGKNTRQPIPLPKEVPVDPSPNFIRVIERAKANVQLRGVTTEVVALDLFIAMLDEGNSMTIQTLKKKGLKKKHITEFQAMVPTYRPTRQPK